MIALSWLVSAALAAPVLPDEVVAKALAHDPALAAAEAAVGTAEGERRAATGLRYDPTLELRLGFGLPQHEVSLAQPVSLSGEGLAAARAAEAGLRAAEGERDRRRLEVAANARLLLILAIAAGAEVERADEVLRLASGLRDAADRRLASGDAPELQAHLARLEEAAAAADVVQAHREALAAREALVATTGLAMDVELPDDPMAAVPGGSASGSRSDRDAAAARVEAADSALQRERAAALPPVDLGAWAQVQGGAWTVGPAIGVTLPVWNGNRAGIAGAEGRRALARSEQAGLESRIGAEQAGSVDRRAVLDTVAATVDPTPEARAALAGVEAAATVGELGAADAALLRAHILDAWGRGARARAEAAAMAVDLALAESWPTLLPNVH